MKEVIFYKNTDNNNYKMDIKDIRSAEPFTYLTDFLMSDVRIYSYLLIEWLENKKYRTAPVGEMYSAIIANGIVEINTIESDRRDKFFACNVYKTSSHNMLSALKQYKTAISIRPHPNKIIFRQDDSDNITIIAEN